MGGVSPYPKSSGFVKLLSKSSRVKENMLIWKLSPHWKWPLDTSRVTIPVLFQFQTVFQKVSGPHEKINYYNCLKIQGLPSIVFHLCYFEFTYLFSPCDQGLQKPHAWARCSAAQVPAVPNAQQAAHSWETVLAPSNYFISSPDYMGKHHLALPNNHQEKILKCIHDWVPAEQFLHH